MGLDIDSRSLSSESRRMEEWVESEVWAGLEAGSGLLVERRESPLAVESVEVI